MVEFKTTESNEIYLGEDLRGEISRDDFCKLIKDKFYKSLKETILEAINKDGIVIDEVFMVGGAMCYHRLHGGELKSELQ